MADAGMVRIVSIESGRTLIIDSSGHRELVTLAGIEITDEVAARELLKWTLLERWALIERDSSGTVRLWRSPDSLFVNRELVSRGCARATQPGILPANGLMVTYLGTINPPPRESAQKRGKETSPRPRASPKRKAKPRK
jgi:hypothetical protein